MLLAPQLPAGADLRGGAGQAGEELDREKAEGDKDLPDERVRLLILSLDPGRQQTKVAKVLGNSLSFVGAQPPAQSPQPLPEKLGPSWPGLALSTHSSHSHLYPEEPAMKVRVTIPDSGPRLAPGQFILWRGVRMETEFTVDRIFDIAGDLERRGAAYYQQAAGVASRQESRELFLLLARMEEDHQRTFASMKAKLSAELGSRSSEGGSKEALDYLGLFADGEVFDIQQGASAHLRDTSSLSEILTHAIAMERDSIAFYIGIKEMVPESSGKEQIDRIIREEMKHARLLSDELVSLRRAGG
jgi:rubrerythrin